MKFRSVVAGGLLLTLLALSAGAAPEKETGQVFDSPEAVFKAAKAAIKKGDVKGYISCMTEDSEKLMTGQMIMTGIMIKGIAAYDKSGKTAEMLKPIEDVFTKHGLTEDVLKKVKPVKDPKEIGKTLRATAELVKTRPAFCAEVIAVLEKANPKAPKPLVNSEMTDLKIDGDKAKATLVSKIDDREIKEPMEFAKVGSGWKLVIPEPKPNPAPKLPPPPKE